MSLTRIDCHFYLNEEAVDRAGYVGLNPSRRPGSLVYAAAAAAREGVSSQVASRLSIEHFIDAVLDYFAKQGAPRQEKFGYDEPDISLEVLESAFKNANASVYDFGHKLAAGGRMAASLLGLVIERTTVAAGRAGPGSVFLFREGELFPFFETRDFGKDEASLERLIGAHSIVSVELASVPVQQDDIVVAFSAPLDSEQEHQLTVLLAEDYPQNEGGRPERILKRVLPRLFPEREELAFAMVACVGPEAIYLRKPVP